MNREIKFRAWNHGINQMYDVYGFNDRQIQWRNELGGLGGSFSYGKNNKNKFTIMQFTGLRDKNGKEIYEGDYFQVAKNKIYTVKWLDIGESDFETYAATFILWLNDETFFPFDEFAIKHGEVISNIYESPELLNP